MSEDQKLAPAIIRTREELERPLAAQKVNPALISAGAFVAAARPPPSHKVKRSKGGDVQHPSGLTLRSADLSRARPFKWAWEQRVLMGYLNLLIGEEGVGKGNLVAWIAARITRGDLPGSLEGGPRRVYFIGDEDSWDHVWGPRLEAAGADLTYATTVVAGLHGTIDVRKDADALQSYIAKDRTALIYFDQLLDNLGITNSWKDKEVRDALAPLRAVARETNSALLASMHPNKRPDASFRERISGTAAFNALSRSSLLAAPHPDEPGRTVVVRGKGNYSMEPDAFEFRIQEHILKLTKPRRTITTSRIVDQRETALRQDDLLDVRTRKRGDSQAGQARARLAEMFPGGENRPAREVLDHLFEVHGLPERVVQRARAELKIPSWQDGFRGPWIWGLKRKRQAKRH